MMKKIIALILVFTFILALSGCKNDRGRILYNFDLEKYVKLGEYKGIKVDTKSENFDYVKKQLMLSDIKNNTFEDKITEGKVQLNDIANIDYVGKKDGVAFEGGTANGYNLTIGSGQFIPGFEEGLVGAKIGSTVDLKLTFPKDYQSTDLAGKDVVFTVKVNYVFRDFYKELGYDTEEEYAEKLKEEATENTIFSQVLKNSKVEKYPEKEKEKLLNYYMSTIENAAKQQGTTAEILVQYNTGMTLEAFKQNLITSEIEPFMQTKMVIYAIFDAEKFEVDKEALAKFTKKIVASYNDDKVTEKSLKEQYGEEYFEDSFIQEQVLKYLVENAKIS